MLRKCYRPGVSPWFGFESPSQSHHHTRSRYSTAVIFNVTTADRVVRPASIARLESRSVIKSRITGQSNKLEQDQRPFLSYDIPAAVLYDVKSSGLRTMAAGLVPEWGSPVIDGRLLECARVRLGF